MTAFVVVFSLFAIGLAVLVALIVRSAFRRDRARNRRAAPSPGPRNDRTVPDDPSMPDDNAPSADAGLGGRGPEDHVVLDNLNPPTGDDVKPDRLPGGVFLGPGATRRWMLRYRRTGRGRRNVRTAFVFAGGGARGAAQIGMLQALMSHGIRPDAVYGASVGAINAAGFAGDPTFSGGGTAGHELATHHPRRRLPAGPVLPAMAVLPAPRGRCTPTRGCVASSTAACPSGGSRRRQSISR